MEKSGREGGGMCSAQKHVGSSYRAIEDDAAQAVDGKQAIFDNQQQQRQWLTMQ